jgi:hypothetical protein
MPKNPWLQLLFAISIVTSTLKTAYDVAIFEAQLIDAAGAKEMDKSRSSFTNPLGFQFFLGSVVAGLDSDTALSNGDYGASIDVLARALEGSGSLAINALRLPDTYKATGILGISSGPRNRQQFFVP